MSQIKIEKERNVERNRKLIMISHFQASPDHSLPYIHWIHSRDVGLGINGHSTDLSIDHEKAFQETREIDGVDRSGI